MSQENRMEEIMERQLVLLERMARDQKTLLELTSRYVNAQDRAESEVPESVRRFVTYMHDVHDVTYMYEQRGLVIPEWILREMERCDDRYRQILEKLHSQGEAFEKIRRQMASDPLNRWDHTRLLDSPKENGNETR